MKTDTKAYILAAIVRGAAQCTLLVMATWMLATIGPG
jgi:hypothetical protein